jgi:hypothetical protein
VVILYDVGLLLALLIGGAIGLLVTAAHYEQIALRQWAYEKEMAERREFYAGSACSGVSSRTTPRMMTRQRRHKPQGFPARPAGRAGSTPNLGSPF